jgi:hypothetical protein
VSWILDPRFFSDFQDDKKNQALFFGFGLLYYLHQADKKCASGKYFSKKKINLINFFISIVIIEKFYVALIAERKKERN